MELDYLCAHLKDVTVAESLQAVSEDLTSGDFPFAAHALGVLLSKRLVAKTPEPLYSGPEWSEPAPTMANTMATPSKSRIRRRY